MPEEYHYTYLDTHGKSAEQIEQELRTMRAQGWEQAPGVYTSVIRLRRPSELMMDNTPTIDGLCLACRTPLIFSIYHVTFVQADYEGVCPNPRCSRINRLSIVLVGERKGTHQTLRSV